MVELGSSDSMTCFNVSIRDDSVVELDEKFVVNLMLPLDSVGVGLGSPNQTCIIIENDDSEYATTPTPPLLAPPPHSPLPLPLPQTTQMSVWNFSV